MLIAVFIILGICLYKVTWMKKGAYNLDYMSVEDTKSIKGIFVLLVFVSHFVQYIELSGVLDQAYLGFRNFLGQLVVTMFLFYSGYGIVESIKKKGQTYVADIPRKRILRVLFDFDMAIILFLIVRYLMGYSYKVKTILLSFVAWSSVGNSNWYIFVILITYLISYIAFKIFKDDHFKAILAVSLLSIIYILIIRNYKPAYAYNTLLSYGAGMWYSYYRDKIEDFLIVENNYLIAVLLVVALFLISYLFTNSLLNYQIKSILFALLITMISMKLRVKNWILNWFGNHVFSIYILQRIPMMVFKDIGIISNHVFLYLILCLGLTIVIALIFESITSKLFNTYVIGAKYNC